MSGVSLASIARVFSGFNENEKDLISCACPSRSSMPMMCHGSGSFVSPQELVSGEMFLFTSVSCRGPELARRVGLGATIGASRATADEARAIVVERSRGHGFEVFEGNDIFAAWCFFSPAQQSSTYSPSQAPFPSSSFCASSSP